MSNGLLEEFTNILKRESQQLSIPKDIEPYLVCYCIIVSDLYSFNPLSVKQYNDAMISSCWGKIERTIKFLTMLRSETRLIVNDILRGRSRVGYNNISNNRQVDVVVSMTRTPKTLLDTRTQLLESTKGNTIITDLHKKDTELYYDKGTVFRSLMMSILHHTSIGCHFIINPLPVQCTHTMLSYIASKGMVVNEMCLTCGLKGPSNIIVVIDSKCIEYHDDQCMDPILYTDNCCCLDPLVAEELQTLLTSYKYATPMSISVECNIDTSPQVYISSIDQSRQIIRIGTVRSNKELVHIWMVRPTINFTSYIIRHDSGTIQNILTNIRLACSAHRLFTHEELKIQLESATEITINGTMAHYYVSKLGLNATLGRVSLGGSTIRLQQIKDYKTIPNVIDIGINMDILKCLVPQAVTGSFIAEHKGNSVSVKYVTDSIRGSGPSFTLGCNGGVQYLGSPRSIYTLMANVFNTIQSRMASPEFLSLISTSRSMTSYMYPSGITRSASHRSTLPLIVSRE